MTAITEAEARASDTAVPRCCHGYFNGFGIECDEHCSCATCIEQREPTSSSPIITVTDARGIRHEIPDIWIAGWCTGARARGEAGEVRDAIGAWLVQAFMAEQDEANRS